MFLGILGGSPEKWANYGSAYRDAWTKAGHSPNQADIGVAVHGFVADNNQEAKKIYLEYEGQMFMTGSAEIGRPMSKPVGREADLEKGMVFAGSPENVAERIVNHHKRIGQSRQTLQTDFGGMPKNTFLRSLQFSDTKVQP